MPSLLITMTFLMLVIVVYGLTTGGTGSLR
jgi:hypothetical protein